VAVHNTGKSFMPNKDEKSDTFLERRRQLLKMGVAGMPMVLTLRASAADAVISQLRCTITVSNSFRILVDDTGAAWMGTRTIRTKRDGSFKPKSLRKFKNKANFIFPGGSASESYRPEECEFLSCEEADNDDHGHHSHDESSSDLLAYLSDKDGTYAMNDFLAGSDEHTHGSGHSACDDNDHSQDEHGHSIPTNEPCGYSLYEYTTGHSITPGHYVSSGGSWNLSGDDGLFLELSIIYADENGEHGRWPGISCLVSVLNYLGH
jgi:hypothetical protein